MRIALVITTYNSPQKLGICLASFKNQTEKNFDIFIADDGSTKETKIKIQEFQKNYSGKLYHYWHEDIGYRKATINNIVFKNLQEYTTAICIDGDTVAHQNFIEDHASIQNGKTNCLFMGRRIDLDPFTTEKVTEENVATLQRSCSLLLWEAFFSGRTKNWSRAIRIKNPFLQKFLARDKVYDLLGSNFSISIPLLFSLNGYNEDYKSYWGEDGDLFVRAKNSKAFILGLKSFAIQYHLYHQRSEPTPEHISMYKSILSKSDYIRCKNGILKN